MTPFSHIRNGGNFKLQSVVKNLITLKIDYLDSDDALEPTHYYCNIRAETLYTTVRDSWPHNFSFK